MTEDTVHLVLLETSGNQRFIFDTNRIREVIGASEMVYQAGTRLVLEAVAEVRGLALSKNHWQAPADLRRFLLNKPQVKLKGSGDDVPSNPPIQNQRDPAKAVEVIIATSGKALLLVKEKCVGEWIITSVTKAVLEDLPGLAMRGVVGGAFSMACGAAAFDEQVKKVHTKLAALGAEVPGAEVRFPRLPIVAPCDSSGLPAARVRRWKAGRGEDTEPDSRFSAVSALKGGYFGSKHEGLPAQGWTRIKESLPGDVQALLSKTVEDLEVSVSGRSEHKDRDAEDLDRPEAEGPDGLDWLSVVHADGNGLGQIFLNFGIILEDGQTSEVTAAQYVTEMRAFSLALDVCTINAFSIALEKTVAPGADGKPPSAAVVPVILGGDDLTVLCGGRIAIRFAKIFLEAFEKQTGRNDLAPSPGQSEASDSIKAVVPKIASKSSALGIDRLSACAGVAIVKGHFPFHQAYHLAEALLKSAKTTKIWTTPFGQLSALDYHILYDSSGADLGRIRARLTSHEPTPDGSSPMEVRLYARPYIVTPQDDEAITRLNDPDGIKLRHWDTLKEAVEHLQKGQADEHGGSGQESGLSRTVQHDLRSALFEGRSATDARLHLINGRLKGCQFGPLLHGAEVFFDLPDYENGGRKQSAAGSSTRSVTATRLLDAMDIVEFWSGEG